MSEGGDHMSHHKEANRIPWHPGFVSAMELELKEEADYLVFDSEHELNKEPLSIDLLIIKKGYILSDSRYSRQICFFRY